MTSRGKAVAPHVTVGAAVDPTPTGILEEVGTTPILREYRAIKAQHPDAILLARLGDFYEVFGADAEVAAPILGITLTGRGFGNAGRLPMCGVPHHASAQYIRRLLDAGRRVALWDQVGEVIPGRLVRREVTRVISPGTVIEADFLEPGRTSRCLALLPLAGRVGLAALDATTGDLQVTEVPGGVDAAVVAEECEGLEAAELLVPEGVEVPAALLRGIPRTTLPGTLFDARRGDQRLLTATGTTTLTGLALDGLPAGRTAAGALLAYCERSRMVLPPGFLRVRSRSRSTVMRLDAQTRGNLELLASQSGTGLSLLGLLDRTRTPMGARLLRTRLQEPLIDREAIEIRLDAVAALVASRSHRAALREALTGVRDLERLTGRCVQGIASPRDLGAIRDACRALPRCGAALGEAAAGELGPASGACRPPDGLGERLAALLVEDPPASARDGGWIRPEADGELGRLLAAGSEARTFIAGLEEGERSRTGIRSLRVGYNRVFGYYLEIPNAHRDGVPADYIRKQTLVGAERYITAELKEQEAIILTARERAVNREQELLRECAALVAAAAASLLGAAAAVALLDVAQALACVADEEAWTRPELDGGVELEIEAGRHPLVERTVGRGRFVANDTALDGDASQVVILTGPNMAGKSTYLRQVALITLLAQIGSFVPASGARVGVCDRIFTRIGARDDLAGGLSTFMVEMAETAAILHQATPRSLVILDEIGRGTSTYDGLSIAQAVIEHLHDAPQLRCRTLFATHYHELTALEGRLCRVRNARVEVAEEGDAITFLHRIVPGGADRSYGIHVAKLAGVPAGVLIRARRLLATLERDRPLSREAPRADQMVLGLAPPAPHPVVEELAQLDLDGLTPLEALRTLAGWQQAL
ncbi:MAG: DNA mismatch repair protein MutS [Candidatus Dormibacteria bacterium]